MAETFKLGDEWPDWWAEKHAANEVTTHNEDGRWRGGPDYAVIRATGKVIRFGETVSPADFAPSPSTP